MKRKLNYLSILAMFFMVVGAIIAAAVLLDPEGMLGTRGEPKATPVLLADPEGKLSPNGTEVPQGKLSSKGKVTTRKIEVRQQGKPWVPLTEQEKQDALNIVKASGIVESINGNQEWQPGHFSASRLPERKG